MPYVKSIKRDIYFSFKAKLFYNPTSNNLHGVDARPKFYLEAKELVEALYWSEDSSAIDRGYHRDANLNFYVRNIYDMDDNEVEVEFYKMASRSPFGYTTQVTYQEYVRNVFNNVQQGKWEAQFQALHEEGKVIAATNTELSHADIICTHTMKEVTKVNRNEFYVPSCTVKGLSKI